MSAARLREAAKVLRERAEAAMPGPWFLDRDGAAGVYTEPDPTPTSKDIAWSHSLGVEAYIAMMHPPVALALADWLDAEAQGQGHDAGCPSTCLATRVADAILGGEDRG